MNFCTKCGAETSQEDQFCRKCGTELNPKEKEKPIKSKMPIKKIGIATGLSIILALSVFFFITRNKTYDIADYFPFESDYHYRLDSNYTSAIEKNTKLKLEMKYLGEQEKEDKSVYVRETKVFYNNEPVNSFEIYYQINENNEVIELAREYPDQTNWHDKPLVIYPSNMKIGEEYTFKDAIDERKMIRKMILTDVQDVTINDQTFEDCLIVERRSFENDELVFLSTESIYKGIGIVKVEEEYFDENKGNLVVTYEEELE